MSPEEFFNYFITRFSLYKVNIKTHKSVTTNSCYIIIPLLNYTIRISDHIGTRTVGIDYQLSIRTDIKLNTEMAVTIITADRQEFMKIVDEYYYALSLIKGTKDQIKLHNTISKNFIKKAHLTTLQRITNLIDCNNKDRLFKVLYKMYIEVL